MNHAPDTVALMRRYVVGASLVILLIAVYLVTYSGYAISRDEWFIFDATESIARRGDLRQNFEFDAYPPRNADTAQPPPADTEPLQPILAAPLLLVAQALPAIGLAHTVWLFNVMTTALTAGVLYAFGLALGYRVRTAVIVALAFGLGTIALPYSRTFFREPLFTLLALTGVYIIERIRQRITARQRPLILSLAFVIVFAGMVLSKEAALLIVPTLVVAAFPVRQPTRGAVILLSALTVIGLALVLLMLNLDVWFDVSISRWDLTHRLQQARSNISDMLEVARGYLYSPGRSMWLFSPVLLLGLLGWPRLLRGQRYREIGMPLVTIASFVLGYAAVRGLEGWYGGLGWGPRYLVPVTPFAALWLLPVAHVLLEQGAAWWKRLGAGFVFLLSASIQVFAALVPIDAYFDYLAAQTPPVIPWLEGTWTARWSPFYIYPQLIDSQSFDLAWLHAEGRAWILPVLAAGLAVLAARWLIWWIRRETNEPHTIRRDMRRTLSTLAAALVVTLFGGLYAIREDPRYYGDFEPLRSMLEMWEAEIQPGDVVVLNDPTYAEFFMNYYKNAEAPVYTLLLSRGERYSPEHTPRVESVFGEELIHRGNTAILNRLAQRHDRMWLVINSSPFIGWSTRPVEQYLARHYFPVQEVKSTDYTRAVLFDTTSAPPTTIPAWPTQRTGALFGDSLHLAGYDIPGGTTHTPGDTIPVSLLWEALAPTPENYTVALFLVHEGQLVAQRDSFPVNHFEFTSAWRPESLHRDNHGIALPNDLPQGSYELWLALYWWQAPTERIPVMNASGELIGDHLVLAMITVQ